MKKIFTLLFAVGMLTFAQAQPGNRDNRPTDRRDNPPIDQRDVHYGNDDNNHHYDNDDRYGNSKFSDERKLKMRIAQINREYDYKIQRVRNSNLSRREKQRQIHFLEDQRQQEIRFVYGKFKNKNRNNGHGKPNNRHY